MHDGGSSTALLLIFFRHKIKIACKVRNEHGLVEKDQHDSASTRMSTDPQSTSEFENTIHPRVVCFSNSPSKSIRMSSCSNL